MAINYTLQFTQAGAELETLRGIEAAWEWMTRVSGASTYFKDKLNAAYDNTIQGEDDQEIGTKVSLNSTVAPALAGAHGGKQSEFEADFLSTFLAKILVLPQTDEGTPIIYNYDPTLLGSGEVRILTRGGVWGGLRAQMIADVQTIKANTVTLGAFTAASGNIGTLTDSATSGEDHSLPGTLQFTCVQDTVEAVQLTVQLLLTNPLIDGTPILTGDNPIQVGKAYEDGQTGFHGTFNLGSVVETGDDGNIFSVTSISNDNEADSTKGKHYVEVERMSGTGGNPDFRVRVFQDGSLVNLLATKDVTGLAGAVVLTIPLTASTITTTFDKTNAAVKLPVVPNKDSDIVFDTKSPRLGDKWTKTVTNNLAGNFATKIATRWRASLNSVTPGNTISDALAVSIAMT